MWTLPKGNVRLHRRDQALLLPSGDPARLCHAFGHRAPFREERIRAAAKKWIRFLTDPDHLDARVAAIQTENDAADTEPADVTRQATGSTATQWNSIACSPPSRAGMDPTPAARQTRKFQTDTMAARSIIEQWGRSHDRPAQPTKADLRAVLTETRGPVKLLGDGDRIERAARYRALGFSINYEKKLQPGRH